MAIWTDEELAHHEEYNRKRTALVPQVNTMCNLKYGNNAKDTPLHETEIERSVREKKWNQMFSENMERLAKTITFGESNEQEQSSSTN
jgi:hypothetical protein